MAFELGQEIICSQVKEHFEGHFWYLCWERKMLWDIHTHSISVDVESRAKGSGGSKFLQQ